MSAITPLTKEEVRGMRESHQAFYLTRSDGSEVTIMVANNIIEANGTAFTEAQLKGVTELLPEDGDFFEARFTPGRRVAAILILGEDPEEVLVSLEIIIVGLPDDDENLASE